MAAVGGNIVRFTYTGAEGEIIPHGATHITVAEDCIFVRARAFRRHSNIIEVICHDKVKKIEDRAFCCCDNLRRVIMPGVKIVERWAFADCKALTYVECGNLEIIGEYSFSGCECLGGIDLPSARIVEELAFTHCKTMKEVKFSNKLERIDEGTFFDNRSLECITIPLKDGIISNDTIFEECYNLKQVHLVEGELNKTIAALHLEEWRNDMGEEIDSINQILPTTYAGRYMDDNDDEEYGGKAWAIRTWIRSVLGKIIHYQAEHQLILDEATTRLQLALPHDIVMNNVLSFLKLPSHFEVEEGIL